MRVAFVHEAALRLEDGSDARAPGAAVTVGLCGHWQHDGACRWPHLTTVAARAGRDVTVRVLFAAAPEEEGEVRARVVAALRRGRVDGAPLPSAWSVLREARAELRPEEAPQAAHLAGR